MLVVSGIRRLRFLRMFGGQIRIAIRVTLIFCGAVSTQVKRKMISLSLNTLFVLDEAKVSLTAWVVFV